MAAKRRTIVKEDLTECPWCGEEVHADDGVLSPKNFKLYHDDCLEASHNCLNTFKRWVGSQMLKEV